MNLTSYSQPPVGGKLSKSRLITPCYSFPVFYTPVSMLSCPGKTCSLKASIEQWFSRRSTAPGTHTVKRAYCTVRLLTVRLAQSLNWVKPSTYESTNAQSSPQGCTSCLAKEYRYRSVEDWKGVARCNKSRFRLLTTERRLKIECQVHEVMNTVCQVGNVQGLDGSIMVGGDFFRGTVCDLWCMYQPHAMQFGT
ncbi:hypothetical protein TNCV_953761 [Trichonephila clavipes]|nr:hypothetical protein TNCV_953761 [Trichonephila clavipes]